MIYTNSDGGARGNPGPGAIGVIIREDDKILKKYSKVLPGSVTNNVAEYHALIKALELASQYTKDELVCCLDSELLVKQLLGEYRVRNPKLLELFLKVQKLQNNFKSIRYVHRPRTDKFQRIPDILLNIALNRKYSRKNRKYIGVRKVNI